jgi:Leucine Rich repeat
LKGVTEPEVDADRDGLEVLMSLGLFQCSSGPPFTNRTAYVTMMLHPFWSSTSPLWRRVMQQSIVVVIILCFVVGDMFRWKWIALDASDVSSPTMVSTAQDGEDSSLEEDENEDDETFEEWFERVCAAIKGNDPNIDELDLDCKDETVTLNEFNMKTLADAMEHNEYVTRLTLQNMTIEEGAAEELKRLLRTNRSITSLTLEEVAGDGCMAVAIALTLNPSSVRRLHLRDNAIDESTARALGLMLKSNRHLIKFRFCHNSINPEGMSHLSLGLLANRGIQILDLSGNRLNDTSISKICNALLYNDTVEYLSLDFNNFGVRGMQAISAMLRKNRRIREMHLFGNSINAEGAQVLSDALRHNGTLEALILSFNSIGDDGAQALGEALTVNTALTKLWFPSNDIGHQGLQAFGDCLPSMKALEELHVGDFFDSMAVEGLLEGLKRNTRLVTLNMQSPISEISGASPVEEELDFYLRLNKSGRSILQSSPKHSLALWPMAFEKANQNKHEAGNPDVLYHMLRAKPDVMEFPV